MSKWLVPLLIASVLCGLSVGLFLRSPFPEETKIAETIPPTPAQDIDLPTAWTTLPVNEFLEQASGALVTRSPEDVTSLGLGDALGVGDGNLAPLSPAYVGETQALEAATASHIHTYDLTEVPTAERLSARVFGRYVDDLVDGHPFADHDYTVHSFITSYPQSLERFLTATHPIRSEQNAADYVQRLSQIEARYAELIEGLRRSESIGAIPPQFILEGTLGELRGMADVTPKSSPLYSVFESKLSALSSLPTKRRNEFLAQAEALIESSILPAYDRLTDYVSGLIERAPDEGGVWRHTNGSAYYAYLLHRYTTTHLTAEEIHEIGLAEVDRLRAEIREGATALNHDSELTLTDLYALVTEEAGTLSGEETRDYCESLLDEIADRISPAFIRMPQQELVVVSGSAAAFYSPGSLDGSRPGLFYAPTEGKRPRYRLPTATYHEAIPGHHFQIALAHEVDIPVYRSGLSFTAFAEGWALYAERLAWEFGAYDTDPYGNLGRLQDEIFRAVRLVVDTGIHALRWSYENAVEYMVENTGLDEQYVRDQVVRYIVVPGQATAYKIGMLKFLELRWRTETALGSAFDLAEFHDRLLKEGSVPLDILEEFVDAYIAEKQLNG